MNPPIGWLSSVIPALGRFFGGFWAYTRQRPAVRCATAHLTNQYPDFFGDHEYESLDVYVRLYNEGYAATYIADAYLEIEMFVPFLKLLKRRIRIKCGELWSSGRPDDRLVGVELADMAQSGDSFRCRFMASDDRYLARRTLGIKVQYWLVVVPMRHSKLKILLVSN